MKSKIALVALLFTFLFFHTSCNTYTVVKSSDSEKGYGDFCSNPKYIATMYKIQNNIFGIENDSINKFEPIGGDDFNISTLLKDARSKYGSDVTITNLRWDVKNGKRKVGVVYDVVQCK
ncbi:MAG: hypothetical protein RLY64_355 [Bacteroidota bacterium]|jgi:hypothetical protein